MWQQGIRASSGPQPQPALPGPPNPESKSDFPSSLKLLEFMEKCYKELQTQVGHPPGRGPQTQAMSMLVAVLDVTWLLTLYCQKPLAMSVH